MDWRRKGVYVSVFKRPESIFNTPKDHLGEKMLCSEMHCNSECPHWPYGREDC